MRLILVHCFVCKYFLLFWGLSFQLVYSLLCCEKKLLSFIQFHLFIFVFIFMTLRGGSEKDLAEIYVTVLPMFSSKSSIVSDLTFRLIYFEFICVYGVRECTSFNALRYLNGSGSPKREGGKYTCMTGSFCYTVETNTTF